MSASPRPFLRRFGRTCAAVLLLAFWGLAASAQTPTDPEIEGAMTPARLARILTALDPEIEAAPPGYRLTLGDVPVVVITDPVADRMRAMIPIRSADGMTPDEVLRVMQANFDTALDARYAIAQGRLWAVFIHPLAALERDELISGLGQTVNLATTYGTLFTGGAMTFGGGDSVPLQRQLIDELLKKGEEI